MDKNNSTGIILPVERNRKEIKLLLAIIFTFFVFLSLIFLVPVLWMILSSFKDTQEFLQVPPTLFPKQISLGKMLTVWKEAELADSYISTLIMVAGDLACVIVFNGLAGYVLSRLKPKGSALILMLVMWTLMMPNNLAMVPRFKTFIDFPIGHFNFTDTFIPMWMMACANSYDALLFKNFFDGISRS